MIKNEKKAADKKQDINYDIEVSRAKELESGDIAFDMVVNGVSIYGCYYKIRQKKTGEDFAVIDFPQKKGKDGNYYKEVYFFVTAETMDKIETAIKEKLK